MYSVSSSQMTSYSSLCNFVFLFCFAVTQNISSYWSGKMDRSMFYRCNTNETLYERDSAAAGPLTKLTVSNMQLEAFQNATKAEFSNTRM